MPHYYCVACLNDQDVNVANLGSDFPEANLPQRKRLPSEVFDEVFQFVLKLAADKKLSVGKTVGVDGTP